MSITFTEEILEGGLRRIALVGTLDAPGAMSIEDEFQALLKEKGGNVIIDLAGVDYMSSYGLRMLLVGAKELKGAGGGLHLAEANTRVMEVITMAGYDTMFPVYESIEEAILLLGG